MICCTSRHPAEDSTSRNTSTILPLFSRPRNAKQPDYSALPKSSWLTRLKEHKGVLGGISGNPGGENIELVDPPRASGMCGKTLGHFCRDVANQKSHSHKSWAQWLTPWSMADWGSLQHYWCYPSYTWYSNGTVAGMWTTFDSDHSTTSLASVWTIGVSGLCGWPFPSPKCNTSIVGKPAQWNTSLCHKWDASRLCLKVSHCDMPLDAPVE